MRGASRVMSLGRMGWGEDREGGKAIVDIDNGWFWLRVAQPFVFESRAGRFLWIFTLLVDLASS